MNAKEVVAVVGAREGAVESRMENNYIMGKNKLEI